MNKNISVRWLFLDLNSFFASVEQQENPHWQGKPIAVVPLQSDHTCAIAASYEAKAFGIKTGTLVHEARSLCPDLICVEARHDVYIDYHHRIIEEVVRHTPVTKIASIDELASRLLPSKQPMEQAIALAHHIKAGITQRIGPAIRCSIGLADNAWLAKVATDMQKPDGLVALPSQDLPGRLLECRLKDLNGIGASMERRLNRAGIWSVEQLYHTAPKQLRHIWGSVEGEKLWYRLHGFDIPDQDTKTGMVGHSRVLDPELRTPDQALRFARRLCAKACQRLRRKGYFAAGFSLSVKTPERVGWSRDVRLQACDDTVTFTDLLNHLWAQMMVEFHPPVIKKVAVTLHHLSPPQQTSGDLFEAQNMFHQHEHQALSRSVERINKMFGPNTVHFGPMIRGRRHQGQDYAGTKIAFNRIPERDEFAE